MTHEQTEAFVTDRLAELEFVKSEGSLIAWHETAMNTLDYLHLSEDQARRLEEGYQRKALWLMGVGAG